MKRLFALLAALLLVSRAVPALAADDSRSYRFTLTAEERADGCCAVAVTLCRADGGGPEPVYGWQDELWYDREALELVDEVCADGVQTAEFSDGDSGFVYISALSAAGALWPEEEPAAVLCFRVLGARTEVRIEQKNALVALPDGSDSYEVSAPPLSFSTTVSPVSEDGAAPAPTPEPARPTTEAPAEPERHSGGGWLIGIAAAIAAALAVGLLRRRTVTFDALGGTAVPARKTGISGKLRPPDHPKKAGAVFGGWYTAPSGGTRWSFDKDRVREDITLYARWL